MAVGPGEDAGRFLKSSRSNAQLGRGTDHRQLPQWIVQRLMHGFGQPLWALRVGALRGKVGQLLQQAFLQFIQLRAYLFDQVRAWVVRRLALELPVGKVGVLHQLVGLDLRRKKLLGGAASSL